MKLYYPLQVVLSVIVMLFPVPLPAEEPDWDMFTVKKEINDLKVRVGILETKWDMFGAEKATACPCPEGGPCTCPADSCPCPDCIDHISNNKVVEIYIKNEKEISKVWAALGDKEDSTMRKAVQTWLRQQLAKKQGLESSDIGDGWKHGQPTNQGRELLYFTASWCTNCPAAEERLGSTKSQIYKIDCSTDDSLAKKYGVTGYPYLLALDDGKPTLRSSGDGFGSYLAEKWLTKSESKPTAESRPAPLSSATSSLRIHLVDEHGFSASQVASMTDAQVQAAHNSAHQSTRRTTMQAAPVYRAPAVNYSTGRNVVRYGGSTWTWPGNLRQHLESVHRVNTAGLSDSQLRTVHDNLHNTGQSGITGGSSYATTPSRTRNQPASYNFQPRVMFSSGYSSNCPSGMCPR